MSARYVVRVLDSRFKGGRGYLGVFRGTPYSTKDATLAWTCEQRDAARLNRRLARGIAGAIEGAQAVRLVLAARGGERGLPRVLDTGR